uniref:Uncharacterized protein n=1 Tax=viral metagenome TaxID=1070528 RepID=A0A6M3L288_9ZZZZ
MTTLAVADGTVDIGGTGQEPIAVLNRWGGERSIMLAMDTTEKALIYDDGVNLIWQGSDTKMVWYPTLGGDFESEIVLLSKPVSNILSLKIDATGLTVHPQPALTLAETLAGYTRPENVIDSLCLFHNTKKPWHPNKAEADKYKTGGWGCIYRVKATDATGKWVWCKQAIAGNVYQIIVPAVWLAAAKYPVVIDPTFGLSDTAGASNTNWGGGTARAGGATYSPAVDGTLDSMSIYGQDSADKFKCAIWHGTTHALIDYTVEGSVPGSVAWATANVVGGAAVYAATAYRLGVKTNAYVRLYWKAVGSDKLRYQTNAYADPFINPASWTLDSLTATLLCYATYTESAGATYVPKIIMM